MAVYFAHLAAAVGDFHFEPTFAIAPKSSSLPFVSADFSRRARNGLLGFTGGGAL
jgi:hypothetical protein